jgi:hypothetical protein
MLTAEVAEVKIGNLSLEGLMDEKGEFYFAVPQLSEIFSFPIKHASRDLKAILGEGFPFPKMKTKLNSKAVNAIRLVDFERLVFELSLKENTQAQLIARSLIGLSLQQLLCDAFGLKFEQEDRQQWLAQRQAHLKSFHPYLTQWLKADAGGDSSKVNWGKAVNAFKIAADLPLVTVDKYDYAQLARLNLAEMAYNTARRLGHDHHAAIGALAGMSPVGGVHGQKA